MRAILGLAAVLLAFSTTAGCPAEITRFAAYGTSIILVKGRIEPDDDIKFAKVAGEVSNGIVLLNSDGGYLRPAIQIGRIVRSKGLATWVATLEGQCASACGFIWLAGTPRMMDIGSKVGFHAAYTMDGGRPSITGAGNAVVGGYMRELGLSDTAIVYATTAGPEAIKWLSFEVAKEIGLDVRQVSADGRYSLADQALPKRIPIPEPAPRTEKETQLSDLFRLSQTSDGKWSLNRGYYIEGASVDRTRRRFKKVSQCMAACEETATCVAFSYADRESDCHLHKSADLAVPNAEYVSGYRLFPSQSEGTR